MTPPSPSPSLPFAPPRALSLPLSLVLALGALAAQATTAEVAICNRRVEAGQSFIQALGSVGIDPQTAAAVVTALDGQVDFRKVRDGDQLRATFAGDRLLRFEYRQNAASEWAVRRTAEDELAHEPRVVTLETAVERVELRIQSSLYEATLAAGERPDFAVSLADVFAWDLDFYRDVQPGDRAVALVEKRRVKGRLLSYGRVLAARYAGATAGEREVFGFQLPGQPELSYFLEDGTSARKTFLKSPLKYANITSRFGSRFHPVLRYLKAHNGVDYGAPIGTPVWSVADGVVTRAGFDRGGGNTVCVRHANALETCYLHLSRYGRGVRAGARVSQKQVIAFSGNTGMSTGPHLHFALKRAGRFVNPLAQKFPRAEPLPKDQLAAFTEAIAPLKARLAEGTAEGTATAQGPLQTPTSAVP